MVWRRSRPGALIQISDAMSNLAPIALAERLALVLALAFFLGLAFEEIYKRDERTIPGGVRTFPLLALAGALLYLVEPAHALAFAAGLIALAAWLYRFLELPRPAEFGEGMSLIVPVANLLVYAIGPIGLIEPPWVAVGGVVAAVLLLGWREEIHGLARIVPRDELLTAGKFLVLVGIILPLAPDTRLFGFAAVTPYRIWLAVVAISTLSYASYLLQRYRPAQGGALLPALLGGAYSSTATTVVLAKRQREAGAETRGLSAGIVAATAVMYLRLLAVVAFFSLPLAVAAAPALFGLALAGALLAWGEWRKIAPGQSGDLAVPAANPLQVTAALVFAVLFLIVSVVTAWAQSAFGRLGILALSVIVGFSDIDPFVLSLAQGGAAGLSLNAVAAAILVAASANNLAKAGYAIGFGGLAAGRQPALLLLLLAVAGFAAAAFYL